MSKHLVLLQRELDALLAWLAPSRDLAGERYELIRHELLRYFEGHHCIPPDEHADETIDRVARRVAAGVRIQSADPIRYCYGVAKNVCLEYRKHRAMQPARDDATVFSGGAARQRDGSCDKTCLSALTPRARELLEAYYLDPRAGLAAREGVTANALRLRVFREKQKLRACLACCKVQQCPIHRRNNLLPKSH